MECGDASQRLIPAIYRTDRSSASCASNKAVEKHTDSVSGCTTIALPCLPSLTVVQRDFSAVFLCHFLRGSYHAIDTEQRATPLGFVPSGIQIKAIH